MQSTTSHPRQRSQSYPSVPASQKDQDWDARSDPGHGSLTSVNRGDHTPLVRAITIAHFLPRPKKTSNAPPSAHRHSFGDGMSITTGGAESFHSIRSRPSTDFGDEDHTLTQENMEDGEEINATEMPNPYDSPILDSSLYPMLSRPSSTTNTTTPPRMPEPAPAFPHPVHDIFSYPNNAPYTPTMPVPEPSPITRPERRPFVDSVATIRGVVANNSGPPSSPLSMPVPEPAQNSLPRVGTERTRPAVSTQNSSPPPSMPVPAPAQKPSFNAAAENMKMPVPAPSQRPTISSPSRLKPTVPTPSTVPTAPALSRTRTNSEGLGRGATTIIRPTNANVSKTQTTPVNPPPAANKPVVPQPPAPSQSPKPAPSAASQPPAPSQSPKPAPPPVTTAAGPSHTNAIPAAAPPAAPKPAPPKTTPAPTQVAKVKNEATPDPRTHGNAASGRPPLGGQTESSMNTRYVNMLLAVDDIPQLHNLLAGGFVWLLLAGFVLFPGTFSTLQEKQTAGIEGKVIGAVSQVPLFVIAWICTGTGAIGMIYFWWRWQRNYIWVVSKIFMPGLLNSLAGLLSTVSTVYGDTGKLTATSESTLIVIASSSGICAILVGIYQFGLLRSVKKEHDRTVGKQRAGEHGEGWLDVSKRKPSRK